MESPGLLCDALKRPQPEAIVHRDRDDTDVVVVLRVFVLEFDVTARAVDNAESVLRECLHDVEARKVTTWHLLHKLWQLIRVFASGFNFVGVEANLAE